MGLATVNCDIAPVYERPTAESTRTDEVLYGMSVQVLQSSDAGWSYLRSEYGTEGYVPTSCLETNGDVAASWRKYKKMVALAPYIDVQTMPRTNSARLASLPRGGILVPLGSPSADGWLKVGLTTGAVGYTRASYLGEAVADWSQISEDDMRWNIVETALSYNGAAFRTGGRTPLGIDAVGLVAMSYQINGIAIPRECYLKPGGVLRAVRVEQMDEGDVLFFHEGVGIYMGNEKFVHASAYRGFEGVQVNSLRAKDPDYRPDLAQHIVAVGSVY